MSEISDDWLRVQIFEFGSCWFVDFGSVSLVHWSVGWGTQWHTQVPSRIMDLSPSCPVTCPLWGWLQLRATPLSPLLLKVPPPSQSWPMWGIKTQPFCSNEGHPVFRTPHRTNQQGCQWDHMVALLSLYPASFSPLPSLPSAFLSFPGCWSQKNPLINLLHKKLCLRGYLLGFWLVGGVIRAEVGLSRPWRLITVCAT